MHTPELPDFQILCTLPTQLLGVLPQATSRLQNELTKTQCWKGQQGIAKGPVHEELSPGPTMCLPSHARSTGRTGMTADQGQVVGKGVWTRKTSAHSQQTLVSAGRDQPPFNTLHLFPVAAVTNYHKLGGSCNRTIFSHSSRGQRYRISIIGHSQSVARPHSHHRPWRRIHSLPLPPSGGCSLPQLVAIPHTSLCSPLTRIHLSIVRTHSNNPGESPHLKILYFVTPAKPHCPALLPHIVTLPGPKD